MYGIVIHSSHPDLQNEYLTGILARPVKKAPVIKRTEYLVVVEELVEEKPAPRYEIPAYLISRKRSRPVYVAPAPKPRPRYVVTQPVAERYEVVKTTYKGSWDSKTGELRLLGDKDTIFDTGLLKW
jgi:hypothetical protein